MTFGVRWEMRCGLGALHTGHWAVRQSQACRRAASEGSSEADGGGAPGGSGAQVVRPWPVYDSSDDPIEDADAWAGAEGGADSAAGAARPA